jgi:hypothetical protein
MYLTHERLFLRTLVEFQLLAEAVEKDFCFAQRRLVR